MMCNPIISVCLAISLLASTVDGLASAQRILGKRGDVSSLMDWASQSGVVFADSVFIAQENNDNWKIDSNGKGLEKGSVLLSVDKKLVFSSPQVVNEMGRETLSEALGMLTKGGFGDQLGEFLIFLKVLKEWDQGTASPWHTWIQCLPREFSTGICLDGDEMDCLPSFSKTVADFERKKLQSFSHCADLVRKCWEQNTLNSNQKRQTIYEWAYNVVYTRCWKFSDDLDSSGTTEMVPMGDLFNHKEPANVAVETNPDDGPTIDFILQTPNANDGLFLSYGNTNPHRFLVIFGFVDESMPEIFSQVVFPDATPEHIALGCNDRSKMVYSTEDGAISGTIWDCVLYKLLDAKPEEQMELYEACLAGDDATKKSLYAKYALETSLTLKNHVDGTLQELEGLQKTIEKAQEGNHPNLPMIEKHNSFLQSVFRKVQTRLNVMVQEEIVRRRAAAVSS